MQAIGEDVAVELGLQRVVCQLAPVAGPQRDAGQPLQPLEDMEVRVVERRVVQRHSAVLPLDLRVGPAPERQQRLLGRADGLDQIAPRAGRHAQAERHRVQVLSDGPLAARLFGPAVHLEASDHIIRAAPGLDDSQMHGEQEVLQRHAGLARDPQQRVGEVARQMDVDDAQARRGDGIRRRGPMGAGGVTGIGATSQPSSARIQKSRQAGDAMASRSNATKSR